MMRRLLRLIIGAAVVGSTICGCGGRRDDGDRGAFIARQRAFPRQTLCDTVYRDSGLPAGFLVNASAEVADVTPQQDEGGQIQSRWIDIVYPGYHATLHCTFVPVSDATRGEVAANRTERMMLNIGDRFAEQTQLSGPGGFHSTILMTGAETPTPVQFLSFGEDWVVSGALRFASERVETDSVMPILEAVKADLIYATKRL